MSEPVALERRIDGRLAAYGTVVALGCALAVTLGRPEVAALVAPLAVLLAGPLAAARRPELDVLVTTDTDRVIEGDEIVVRVSLRAEHPVDVDLLVDVTGGVVIDPPGGVAGAALRVPPEGIEWSARIRPLRWGIVGVGPVHLIATSGTGLVGWHGRSGATIPVRVLPAEATLRTLLDPVSPRAIAGAHRSRRLGDGLDRAGIRPYEPGDRWRDIDRWRTARLDDGSIAGDPWVTTRHPDRAGDVVLVLDTFADDHSGGAAGLERIVQAAWAVAAAHLAHADRVGVILSGGLVAWLEPGGGERARYRILDRLLTAQAYWTEVSRRADIVPPRVIVPGALVIAITPLHDHRFIDVVTGLRHRGHDVSVLVVDALDLVVAPSGVTGPLAVRTWRMQLADRADILTGAGIAVAHWGAGTDPSIAVADLDRARRAPARGGR